MTHRAALFAAIWLSLTAADPGALPLGAAVVGAAVWLSLQLSPPAQPLVLWRLVRHLPRFLWGSLTGGVDVARRAFSSDMRLNPGWLEIPQRTPAAGARVGPMQGAGKADAGMPHASHADTPLPGSLPVVLGAEVSLMPGTLSAGSVDGRLLIHLLDRDGGFDAAILQETSRIAAILGQTPRGGDT
ncbi:multicomponent Na+:H+ antiporter subunit E [Roseicitreum antarcticum]|uniref:Multicomponent Na+:H+ antiporter subunit E n=2 Tax=Roseicitreum antarcticum TaxID=564137 RepID=A0A1H3D5S2_9RHOB|nr:multicomponent Na+:H+ antiporter subunit E [Roseicitreum antarcticum]